MQAFLLLCVYGKEDMASKTGDENFECRYVFKSTLIIDPLILRKDRDCSRVAGKGEKFVSKLPPKDPTEISIAFTT